MADEYATLRAAEAAGARIQAYTLFAGDDGGVTPFYDCPSGYWRTLEEPANWSCHQSRYRVHPEDVHGVTSEECAPQRREDVL